MTPPIRELFPAAKAVLNADQLDALYAPTDRTTLRVRVNFIASLDGAATVNGVSGPLGNATDKRIFDLVCRLSDVVLVAAGTVRDEGYGALRVDDEARAWRIANGQSEHPRFAIVSNSLNLDPASSVFTDAPSPALVLTAGSADPKRRAALSECAEIIDCGADSVEIPRLLAALSERQLFSVLCEGGPTFFGALIAADAVDELVLSVSPVLVGADGHRIAAGTAVSRHARTMALAHVLESEGFLFTRYTRN